MEPRGSAAGREKKVFILRVLRHLPREEGKEITLNRYLYICKVSFGACELLRRGLNSNPTSANLFYQTGKQYKSSEPQTPQLYKRKNDTYLDDCYEN